MTVTLSGLLSQTAVGLSLGMIYVMLALGLSLIFGLLGIVNFAHGACSFSARTSASTSSSSPATSGWPWSSDRSWSD